MADNEVRRGPDVELIFTPQAMDAQQAESAKFIRDSCRHAAEMILAYAPPCADTTSAVRDIGVASMTAVRAIATHGKAM